MFGVGYEITVSQIVQTAAVIGLMGGVIKLMDDFLDLRYDVYVGARSLAIHLGEGSLPYALIGFTLATMIDAPMAAAIMAGAYVAGMAGDFDRQLPSGLMGYQESLLVLILALIFLPWTVVVWAVCALMTTQIADDLYDIETDRFSGNPNLVRRVGFVEAHMLGLLFLCAAASLNPIATALTFALLPVVLWICSAGWRSTVPNRGWIR